MSIGPEVPSARSVSNSARSSDGMPHGSSFGGSKGEGDKLGVSGDGDGDGNDDCDGNGDVENVGVGLGKGSF